MVETTQEHHVVQLDSHLDIPTLRFPHRFTRYHHTTPSKVAERLSDATLVISTMTLLSRERLMSCGPNVQLISSLGAGTDKVDTVAATERGITVTNTPAQNTATVAEHALSLYFAVKRKIVQLHDFTMDGEKWKKAGVSVTEFGGVAPRVAEEETVGIVGYGALGKRMEKLCKALDMRVLIAERKNAPSTRPERTPFETVLRTSTLLFLLCPLDPSTHNMLSHPELSLMQPSSILINAGRGGVVNETALATALREHRIGGAGIDVFETEPATKETCPLLQAGIPNLVVTPHLAWFSAQTIKGTKVTVRDTIEAFVRGEPINVVAGPGVGRQIEENGEVDAEENGASKI